MIMSLTPSDLKKLSHLAKIEIDSHAAEALQFDLNAILQLIGQLTSVDTQDTMPLFHPLEIYLPLRADTVTEVNQLPDLSTIAPRFAKGHYLVPKVIDEDTK
jgi:aspartyl-tRNA(Asn)/glutamyl-tRNA(Gln) amidotransferase subunit C